MIDLKQPIYRYIPYESFLEMLCLKRINASSPMGWPDKYELYGLKQLESIEGVDELRSFIKSKNLKENTDIVARRTIDLVRICFHRVYAICFSEEGDSEPLWRAYSGQTQPIMFATTGEELMKLTNKNGYQDSFIERVQYDLLTDCTFKDYLASITVNDGSTMMFDPEQLFRHKRKNFEYEKEVRFLLNNPGPINVKVNDTRPIRLPIPDLSSFFKGVMTGPNAKAYQIETTEAICRKYGIRFLGPSTVYEM